MLDAHASLSTAALVVLAAVATVASAERYVCLDATRNATTLSRLRSSFFYCKDLSYSACVDVDANTSLLSSAVDYQQTLSNGTDSERAFFYMDASLVELYEQFTRHYSAHGAPYVDCAYYWRHLMCSLAFARVVDGGAQQPTSPPLRVCHDVCRDAERVCRVQFDVCRDPLRVVEPADDVYDDDDGGGGGGGGRSTVNDDTPCTNYATDCRNAPCVGGGGSRVDASQSPSRTADYSWHGVTTRNGARSLCATCHGGSRFFIAALATTAIALFAAELRRR